jgi:uncharacterized protein
MGFFSTRPDNTYYLTVLTATACNLGCSYCFQNIAQAPEGAFNPPRIVPKALTPEVTEQILAFAASNMARVRADALHILLFGGEPLLNAKGAIHLLEQARMQGLRSAEMVTNGTLLTATVARRLAEAGLTRLQITFDGDPASHDTLRVTRNGRPTFQKILRNIRAASAVSSFEWIFRVNVADPNAFDILSLLDAVKESVDPKQATVSFHLIDDVGVGYSNDQTYLSWQETAELFTRWYSLSTSHYGFNVPLPSAKNDCAYCSERDGQTGAVVNADGVLYSCWESAGKPGWEVGDVRAGYLPQETVSDRWVSCGYEARPRWTPTDHRLFTDRVDAANLENSPALAGLR